MHVMFVYMYCIFIKQWKSGSRSCGIVPGHYWMPLHVMIAMVHLRVFVSVRWWKRPGQPTWPLPKEPLGSCSRVQWSKLMCPCVFEYSCKKLTKTYSYICVYIYTAPMHIFMGSLDTSVNSKLSGHFNLVQPSHRKIINTLATAPTAKGVAHSN